MLARKLMLSLVADFQQNKPLVLNPKFLHGLKSILSDSSLDKVWMVPLLFFSFQMYFGTLGELIDYLTLLLWFTRNLLQKQ